MISCVSIAAEAARVVRGPGGAEELRKPGAHLRVGGLSEGQPGHHRLCHESQIAAPALSGEPSTAAYQE